MLSHIALEAFHSSYRKAEIVTKKKGNKLDTFHIGFHFKKAVKISGKGENMVKFACNYEFASLWGFFFIIFSYKLEYTKSSLIPLQAKTDIQS